MTPMPPEVMRTLAAYRTIITKVQTVLWRQGGRISTLDGLQLALIPDGLTNVSQMRREGYLVTTSPTATVKRLKAEGCIVQNDGGGDARKHLFELTPKGIELAEAIRKALGGEDVVRMEAAE